MNTKVNVGNWIYVGESKIRAHVFRVFSDTEVYVGYLQNGAKAVGEDVTWDGHIWRFKYDGPNGVELRGSAEALVKRGSLY